MPDEKYFVLAIHSGYGLRAHDFERAANGSLIFTEEEALAKFRQIADCFMPVAVPVAYVQRILDQCPELSRETTSSRSPDPTE